MATEMHSLKEFAENFIGPQRTSEWRSTLARLKRGGMEKLTQAQCDEAFSDAENFLYRWRTLSDGGQPICFAYACIATDRQPPACSPSSDFHSPSRAERSSC